MGIFRLVERERDTEEGREGGEREREGGREREGPVISIAM